MNPAVRAVVVLVDVPGGRLVETVVPLARRGYSAVHVRTQTEAIALLAQIPSVAAVVLDDAIGFSAIRLTLEAVRVVHPGVAAIWTTSRAMTLGSFGPELPDMLVTTPFTADKLADVLDSMLRGRVTRGPFVRAMGQGFEAAVAEAYDWDCTFDDALIGWAPHAGLAGFVPLCGEGVRGGVTIVASELLCTRLSAAVGARRSPRDVAADLARIAGELGRDFFVQRGATMVLGAPCISAVAERVVSRAATPLLLRLEGDGFFCYCEIEISRAPVGIFDRAPLIEPVLPGAEGKAA